VPTTPIADTVTQAKYYPHLDGLRAVAVVGVLIQHWFDQFNLMIGTWGVTLFFVISGYLITGIILDLRASGLSQRAAAVEFFAKRTLRLFPAYYLVLLCASLLIEGLKRDWIWYALYLSNLLPFFREEMHLVPTWSLAVEEQFYLVWFFVVFALPLKRLPALIVACILLAPLSRYVMLAEGYDFAARLLWTNCDALAAGALLCFWIRDGKELPPWLGIVSLAVFALTVLAVGKYSVLQPGVGAVVPSAIVFVSVYLVWHAQHGFTGVVAWLLGNPIVIYLGKISYGIYLYHMIAPRLPSHIPYIWRFNEDGTLAAFVLRASLTIALAAISYRYFESPIRKLYVARR